MRAGSETRTPPLVSQCASWEASPLRLTAHPERVRLQRLKVSLQKRAGLSSVIGILNAEPSFPKTSWHLVYFTIQPLDRLLRARAPNGYDDMLNLLFSARITHFKNRCVGTRKILV